MRKGFFVAVIAFACAIGADKYFNFLHGRRTRDATSGATLLRMVKHRSSRVRVGAFGPISPHGRKPSAMQRRSLEPSEAIRKTRR
jgi:hypothetical protein